MPSSRKVAESEPTRVFLVRHGRSTFNAQQRFQGRSDEAVLTPAGAAAAALTGRHLAHQNFDALISSPLRRARQTADITRDVLDNAPPIETSEDLRELDLGAWQGMTTESVQQRFPDAFRIWLDRPHELEMTAADGIAFSPVRDLFEQAGRFWRRFLPRHAGQKVLVVTHGGTARALIGTAISIGVKRFHSFQHSNCGISILEFREGSARLEALNLTAHLGERVPKLKQGKQGLRALLFSGVLPAKTIRCSVGALRTDFSCSTADPESKRVAAEILGPSREIRISQEEPESWEQALRARLRDSTEALTTGIFIGPSEVLSGWFAKVLQIQDGRRPWKSFGSAVLHYPGLHSLPVIQAFHSIVCGEAQP